MKTVLITGVSRGLGLETARRLLADPEQYRIIGTSRGLSEAYETVVNESNGRAEFIKNDLGDINGIPGLIGDVVNRHGPLWGLVNNAAIGTDGVLATMHQKDIQAVLTINLMAPLVLIKYASRGMLAQKQGRIVSISSIIASTGFHGLAAYAASKAGLEGMTRSLSRELGKRNITVNCVAPGYMETEMTQGLDLHKMASIRRRAPLGLARPEDAAGAVAYLLGPEAGRITGTIITIDGGSTA
ncbi:MAG: SDR family NAD(P)-dependent oxidoreductase [Albidovulum sp.]